MGFMRKFKDFMGVPEDEYMDDEEIGRAHV